jgi:hypothetical protein
VSRTCRCKTEKEERGREERTECKERQNINKEGGSGGKEGRKEGRKKGKSQGRVGQGREEEKKRGRETKRTREGEQGVLMCGRGDQGM